MPIERRSDARPVARGLIDVRYHDHRLSALTHEPSVINLKARHAPTTETAGYLQATQPRPWSTANQHA